MKNIETEKSNDGVCLEFEALRDEILLRIRMSVEIFGVTLAAVGILMGLGINSKIWAIFLIPPCLSLLSLYYTIEHLERIMFRITSYIRCFLETEESSLKWETRSKKLREIAARQSPFRGRLVQYYFYLLIIFINILLAGYYKGLFVIALISGIIFCSLVAWHLIRLVKRYHAGSGEYYFNMWKRIKEEEEGKGAT